MTRVHRRIAAPRERVYAALVDAEAVARWRFPRGMECVVHEWDARPGGRLRVSLTYTGVGRGKTTARTDTYRGRFVELVPDERVVEVDEFETDDAAFQGEMRMVIVLADDAGATTLEAEHTGLPAGVRAEDNAAGWNEALARLAALVE